MRCACGPLSPNLIGLALSLSLNLLLIPTQTLIQSNPTLTLTLTLTRAGTIPNPNFNPNPRSRCGCGVTPVGGNPSRTPTSYSYRCGWSSIYSSNSRPRPTRRAAVLSLTDGPPIVRLPLHVARF